MSGAPRGSPGVKLEPPPFAHGILSECGDSWYLQFLDFCPPGQPCPEQGEGPGQQQGISAWISGRERPRPKPDLLWGKTGERYLLPLSHPHSAKQAEFRFSDLRLQLLPTPDDLGSFPFPLYPGVWYLRRLSGEASLVLSGRDKGPGSPAPSMVLSGRRPDR